MKESKTARSADALVDLKDQIQKEKAESQRLRRLLAEANSENSVLQSQYEDQEQRLASFVKNNQAYLDEGRQKWNTLENEVKQIWGEIEEMRLALRHPRPIPEGAEETIRGFRSEIEYLKKVHPLKGLVEAKNLEIDRLKKALERIPRDHEDRRQMELMVKDHIIERDHIRELLKEMEGRLEAQSQALDATGVPPVNDRD